MNTLPGFADQLNIAIIGAHGGIGQALVQHYMIQHNVHEVVALVREPMEVSQPKVRVAVVDYEDESTVAAVAASAIWDIVIIAIGVLTDDLIAQPEKSFKQLSAQNLLHIYRVNTVYPAVVAKHFLPRLNKSFKSVLAILSARVGSISDNKRGGWHAYRSSKSALNMLIKNFAIEMRWVNKQAIIIGLHPGTVDTRLSQPFQANLPAGQLFTPPQAAGYLAAVVQNVNIDQSGSCLAWDGSEVPT